MPFGADAFVDVGQMPSPQLPPTVTVLWINVILYKPVQQFDTVTLCKQSVWGHWEMGGGEKEQETKPKKCGKG